jgi:hypothetical protein
MEQLLGRNVTLVCACGGGNGSDSVMTTPDGMAITVNLPIGEQQEGQYMQIEGKVVDATTIDVIRVLPIPGEINIGNYAKVFINTLRFA